MIIERTPDEQRIYWNSRAKKFRRYEGERDSYATAIFENMQKHGISLRGMTVLDLGCGSGGFSIGMAREGAKVTAMDISSEMLKIVAEDAKTHGVPDIVCIESDWASYVGKEKYDMIFCSLTPAIYDDFTRDKLLDYAEKYIVYLGFMPPDESSAEQELYRAHGVEYRPISGAVAMHEWLERNGIEHKTHSLRKKHAVKHSHEETLNSYREAIKAAGGVPDDALIEKFIEQYRISSGEYILSSYANVDMIILGGAPMVPLPNLPSL